jgi:hypothetical protein
MIVAPEPSVSSSGCDAKTRRERAAVLRCDVFGPSQQKLTSDDRQPFTKPAIDPPPQEITNRRRGRRAFRIAHHEYPLANESFTNLDDGQEVQMEP